jgi:hypothetical protein
LAENERCVIYKDWRRTITPQQADVLAKEYQTNIYPKITPLFGEPLEGHGKLVILLLDIIDGFSADSNSYMAGYFDSSNMYSKETYQWSNEAEMLYMDTVEGRLNRPSFNATLAHELQHLLRYSEYLRRVAQTGYEKNAPAETWLDEGLSTAAEYVYLGYHAVSPVWYYNEDPYHKILGGIISMSGPMIWPIIIQPIFFSNGFGYKRQGALQYIKKYASLPISAHRRWLMLRRS